MSAQDKSSDRELRRFWNWWDATYLESAGLSESSIRRGDEVLRILKSLALQKPEILEVGCGNGWLAKRLMDHGRVTAVDIADEVIARAREAIPDVHFLTGDVTAMDFGERQFDVLVTVETIGNVSNHQTFVSSISRLIRPDGYLILTAQNKYVFDRRADIPPPEPGQIRNWIDRRDCRELFRKDFHICSIRTVMPAGHLGMLRYVNSYKLNALADRLGFRGGLDKFRESIGLGQTIVMLARRK